jgi:hypothetical protein
MDFVRYLGFVNIDSQKFASELKADIKEIKTLKRKTYRTFASIIL